MHQSQHNNLPSKNLLALHLVVRFNLDLEISIGCTLCKYTIAKSSSSSNSGQSSRPSLIDAKILYDTQNPINLYDKNIQNSKEFIKDIIENIKTWAYPIIVFPYNPKTLPLSVQDTIDFSSNSFCSFSESFIGINKIFQISFLFDTILDCGSILNNMKSLVSQTNNLNMYLNSIESIRVDINIQIEIDSNQHIKQVVNNDLNVFVSYRDMIKVNIFQHENILLYKEYSKIAIKSILSKLIQNKNETNYYDQYNISSNQLYRDFIALSCGMLQILWYITFKDSNVSNTETLNEIELQLLSLLNVKIIHINAITNNGNHILYIYMLMSYVSSYYLFRI